MLRWQGVEVSASFAVLPHLFVNPPPMELDSELAESLNRVRKLNPATGVVMEIALHRHQRFGSRFARASNSETSGSREIEPERECHQESGNDGAA